MIEFSKLVVWALALGAGQGLLEAQSLAALRGSVTDPSGRVIPNATVTLSGRSTATQTTHTDIQGQYQFRSVASGTYTLRVTAKGFANFERVNLEVADRPQVLDIPLALASTTERITVEDASKLQTDPASNASALVLRGKDLEALSDDRDDLATDLQALAGPAAGPNGGQIYIDGFTGGRLPPKSSIREVRVNQNPFSAQYDRLGYGRIEIFTKPGTENFHGELVFAYGNDIFNSRNPFADVKPYFERRQWEGEVTGPLGKKTTFFADFEIRRMTENAYVNALTLDSNLQTVRVTDGLLTPVSSTEENFKLDHQLAPGQTLTARYTFARDSRENQGVGGFSLSGRAYQNHDSDDTIQAIETGVFGAHLINEARARYSRQHSRQNGTAGLPTISVLDAFTGGGSPLQLSFTNQDRFELANVTSLIHGMHVLRWGGRLRGISLKDQDSQNYTGTYTFSSLDAYRVTLLGLQNGLLPAQIRAAGGGASQFSIAGGNPLASLNQVDLGFFAQDDWRIRPNVTFSAGLRYEGQTHLSDHRDVAPRIGIAWALGTKSKTPKAVIRLGAGMFYDRVGESLTLDSIRRDGIHQQQFVIPFPDSYPAIPSIAQLTANQIPQAIRRISSRLAAPYLAQTALSFEKQLPKNIAVTATYMHTRGVRSLRSRNINSPIAGAYPFVEPTAIYLYESSGGFHQDQVIGNVNARVSPKLTISGSYTWDKAMSDTDGAGTFPADPYNLQPEYGRAGFDIRHRVQMNGSITAPWGLRFSPLLVATSGRPFNIVLGRDLNGDTLFTDRPAFAADPAGASVVRTAFGIFDLAPKPGQPLIPRNYGNGPAQFAMNLRLARTFTLAEPKSKSRDPYELTLSVSARNVFNHPNLGLPVGNLSSPLFGHSTSLVAGGGGGAAAGNRRLDLQVKFSF